MENEKIKQLEVLLRKDNISEDNLKDRLNIFNGLYDEVFNLMGDISEFKGIEVYGSVLNGKFNSKSDIDINIIFDNYSLGKIKDIKLFNGWNYDWHIRNELEKKTERDIHPYMSIDGKKIKEICKFKNWFDLITPFGVFIGDEVYRKKVAKSIIIELKKIKIDGIWNGFIKKFDKWVHKDLTNPEENYRLSSFEKLVKDYKLN